MPDTPSRVAIDRVDWKAVLPVLRLCSALRHALQPGKLLVALFAVALLHGTGLLLDEVWSDSPGETAAQQAQEPGIYESLVDEEGAAFAGLIYWALAFEHGIGPEAGVADALHAMVIAIPRALFDAHPWFAVAFGFALLLGLMLAGGVICRMAATQVCTNRTTSLPRAAGFVGKRWGWYVITPLMPLILVMVFAVILVLAGLVFFNAPFLDVTGSIGYGLLLLMGFVIATVTLLMLFALFLMPPALSVEGTDGFDAIARSFNYILFRPWQFAGYVFSAAFYMAVVYVLVAILAGLTLEATHGFVGLGSFAGVSDSEAAELTRYDAIVVGGTGADDSFAIKTSAWITSRWFDALAGLAWAVMFSVFCCLQTQIYVLMRRTSDGTPLDDCAQGEVRDLWAMPEEMGDPAAEAIASAGPAGPPKPEGEKANATASDTPGDSPNDSAGQSGDEPDRPATEG